VGERTVRYVVRGLVAIVMACAVVATWALRMTLTPRSGTFYALLVYIPVLATPGWLVWQRPLKPRFLAIWGAVGWVSTIIWLLVGQPYSSERELAGFDVIELSLWIAVAIVVVVVPIAAFLVAGYNRRGGEIEPEQMALARRLRRIAQLALGIGLVAIALSLVPLDVSYYGVIVPGVAIGLALLLAPAAIVLRAPRRKWAWLWSAWSAPTALIGWAYGSELYDHVPTTWQLSFAACGTIYVLLLVVMPIVCLVTRDAAPSVPAARVR
jgi:hypothetical protein